MVRNAFSTSHSPITLLSSLPTTLFLQLSSSIIPYSPFLFWALTSNHLMMLQFANPIDPPTCDPNICLNPISCIIPKTYGLFPNSSTQFHLTHLWHNKHLIHRMVKSLPNKVYLNTSIHVGHVVIKSNSFPISTSIPSIFTKPWNWILNLNMLGAFHLSFPWSHLLFTNSCHFMPRNTKNCQLLVDKLAQDLFDVTTWHLFLLFLQQWLMLPFERRFARHEVTQC